MSSFIVDCKGETSNYWNRTDTLLYYFNNIKDYPLLSRTEERKLLETVKYGNKYESTQAMHKLVLHNQRFVASIVRRYSKGDDMLDMISEANIGLIEAINKFELKNSGKLITYAVYWIRKKINEYRIVKSKAIQTLNSYKVSTYITRVNEDFFNEHYRYPTEEEILDIINEKYKAKLSNKDDVVSVDMISINTPIYQDDKCCECMEKGEISLRLSNNNINEEIENNYNSNLVEYILMHLNERQRLIIKDYFGIDGDEMTVEAIALKYSMSKERIRQIINDSLQKLRKIEINDRI